MIREGRNTDGKLNFQSLNENFKFISDFEVYDIDNKNIKDYQIMKIYIQKNGRKFFHYNIINFEKIFYYCI